jgi:hypothetical protein
MEDEKPMIRRRSVNAAAWMTVKSSRASAICDLGVLERIAASHSESQTTK